ncbi:MAG: Eco47II family restriction endonuclease [Ruminococcus sp.]|nr:Eco47II family restriction endonuclease [Ruminococcus sp.]
MSYNLKFISQCDFENHVKNTIKSYKQTLETIDLKKFNANIIDPIKMTFDKYIFNKTFSRIIEDEISRQRDKSNNNAIGYFHQNIFKYFNNCEVPKEGWDVIFIKNNGTKIFVEMKNKHNTMNSSSSQKTYIQMQNQIMKCPNDQCFLVEAIAPKSKNIPWSCSVNKQHLEDTRIRRVSMDKFYTIVTGEKDAFYQMCMQLPITIEKIISQSDRLFVQEDTVIKELNALDIDMQLALYKLAFNSYDGFSL